MKLKLKKLFVNVIFILALLNLNAQIDPVILGGPRDGKRPCATPLFIEQECNQDGTVDISFLIFNESDCSASGVTITDENGNSQHHGGSIPAQSVGFVPVTYSGAISGTTLCLNIKLNAGEGVCCGSRICIDVEDLECCDLRIIYEESGLCAPEALHYAVLEGGTPPYSVDFVPSLLVGGNQFQFYPLDGGTYTANFTDSDGCQIEHTFIIPDELEATISLYKCTKLIATISGGTPPYTSDPSTIELSENTFDITGLNRVTFYDSEYCEIDLKTNKYNYLHGCSNLINRDHNDAIDNLYEESFISTISKKLVVTFTAYEIQDRLIVTVGDDVVADLTAGTSSCGLGPFSETVSEVFCINPCDSIKFQVEGDICEEALTAWNFNLSCIDDCGNGGDLNSEMTKARSISTTKTALYYEGYYEELKMNSKGLVEVLPNPVSNVLTITNPNNKIKYKSARILNSAGNVIQSENMSGMDQVQIDATAFPAGVYLIEMTDEHGIRIVEKFIKL